MDVFAATEITGYGIIAYLGVVTVLIVLHLAARAAPALKPATAAIPAIYLVASLAVLAFARRNILPFDRTLNPDEAQMAANAMLTEHGWLNWNIVDPITSGPLNSAILAWPYLFGGDVTLASGRLTAIACIVAMLAFLFLALRRLGGDGIALLATAPAIAFFAAHTQGEFLHYSSALLPSLLIALAIFVFVASFDSATASRPALAAFILGLVPFAKLQAAPIAAVLGMFVLARAAWTGHAAGGARGAVERGGKVLAASLLPAAIFLIPLAAVGGFNDFVKSALVEQALRMRSWDNPVPKMFDRTPFAFAFFGLYFAIVLIALAARLVRSRHSQKPPAAVDWALAAGAAMTPAAALAILAPGRHYTHYLIMIAPPLFLFAGAALTLVVTSRAAPRGWTTGGGWAAVAVALAFILTLKGVQMHSGQGGAFLQGKMFTAPRTLSWLGTGDSDRMVCWGWLPECYVNAAVRPATRDATNEHQIYDTALRDYFRARFLADFERTRPDFVVDAVAPGSFGFKEPDKEGIETFPEFAAILDRDFAPVSRVTPPERCPRLYVRRERLAELDRTRIAFRALSATASASSYPPEALDDGATFEICSDHWLLPDNEPGAVEIEFASTEPLRRVAILNTRNGDLGNYSSDRVRLSAVLDGAVVAETELTLQRFPWWTWHEYAQPVQADGLRIEVLSWRGRSGGLNEVKAYRD